MRSASVRARLLGVVLALLVLASIPLLIGTDSTPAAGSDREPAAVRRESLTHERAGDYGSAAGAWHRLATMRPHRVEAWLHWHETLMRMGRAHEAHARFAELHRDDPSDPVYAFLRSYALLWQTANWRSHEKAFEQAIARDPTSPWPRAYQYLRQSHATEEERDRALDALDRCVEIAPDSPACRHARGRMLMKIGENAAAAADLSRALELAPDWFQRTALYTELFQALLRADRPEEAARVARRGFDEFAARDDLPSLLRMASLGRRGATSDPRAEKLLQDVDRLARSARARVCGSATEYLAAECHRHRAAEHMRHGRHAAAIHEIDRTLEILRDLDAPLAVAHLLVDRCRRATSLGWYEQALPDCEAAEELYLDRDMFSEALAPLHWRVHLYRDTGAIERALETGRRYVRLARRYGYEGEPVSALDDLAWIAWRIGDLDLALEAFEEMRARVDRLGTWTFEVARLYEAMGDHRGALLYYERGLDGSTGGPAEDDRERLRSLHGLARVRLALGDTTLARSHARAYHDAWIADPGISGLPAPNLTEVLLAEGRHADALRAARALLRRARTSGSSNAIARARAEVARVHLARGRDRQAERELVDLVEEYEALGLYWERDDVLLALALARGRSGDREGAFAALAEARSRVAVTRNPETRWRIEHLEGRLFEQRGEAGAALAAYERAIGILEAVRFRIPPGDLRSRYLTGRLDPYEAAIRIHLGALGAEVDPAAALTLSERKKARALRDRIGDRAGRSPGESERRMALLLPALADEIDRSETRLDRVRRPGAEIDSLSEVEPPAAGRTDVESIQAALRPGRALVEYTFVRDTLWAFVVRPDGVSARRLSTSRERLKERIGALHAPLDALAEGAITIAQAPWPLTAAHGLYHELVQPLEADLAGIGTLLIVPEAELWMVPFDALVTRSPAGPSGAGSEVLFERYERTGFLIDRYATAYLPSADWLLLPFSGRRPPQGEMVIFGNPAASGGTRSGPAFFPLPAAGEEARRIQAMWPGATLLSLRAATEKRFVEDAPDFRFVHVAAHAVADAASPGSSGIALAEGGGEDGFLSALEISRLSLSADLVSLSACRTAAGAIRSGEGVMALSRAFLEAGAPTVLATQWAIPDESGGVMPGFYERLRETGDPVESLRRAKLEFLARRDRVGERLVSRAHPVYWAPFVLVGRPSIGSPDGATSTVAQAAARAGVSSP